MSSLSPSAEADRERLSHTPRWCDKKSPLMHEQGLILGLVTTSANESDIKHLEDVRSVVKPIKGTWVKADKDILKQKQEKAQLF